MRSDIDVKGDALKTRSRFRRALSALTLAFVSVMAMAAGAQAAAPAWKILAASGPTNLPPKQSEVQRVAVEAQGGEFTLSQLVGEGEGAPAIKEAGHVTFVKGATTATVVDGSFEVGMHTTAGSAGIRSGTEIVSCSSPGCPAGSTLTLSDATTQARTNQVVKILDKELVGVTGGPFHVGDALSGSSLAPGTIVTSVGPGTLGLSKFPVGPLAFTVALTASQITAPLAHDAPAQDLQSALEALPILGAGSVAVSGGPGGDAEHPYFVAFAGPLADQDVGQLSGDASGLAGEHAAVHVFTTVPGGAGTGEIVITVNNVGGAQSLGGPTVQLGPLPPGVVIAGPPQGPNPEAWSCPSAVGESSITCTSAAPVKPLSPAASLLLPVEVQSSNAIAADVQVEVSGGAAPATYEMPLVVSSQPAGFGAAGFWAGAFDENGAPLTQAGAHPFSAQSFFLVNTVRAPSGKVVPAGDPKTVMVDLPPGFVGNPLATPRCPQGQLTVTGFEGSELCNEAMELGLFSPILNNLGEDTSTFVVPFFNDVPAQGYAAEFTTKIGFPLQSLVASVNSEEDFGIRVTAPNNPNYLKIFGAFAAFEGSPPGAAGKSIFGLSTDCAEQAREAPLVRSQFDTWQDAGAFVPAEDGVDAVTGCDKLEFHPSFSFQPTTTNGSAPVGATARLHIPQDGLSDPGKLRTPDLKRAVVTLPPGLVLNPSSANGLEGCSEGQIGYRGDGFELPNPRRFTDAHPACPDGSKLGTVRVDTPLLEAPLSGTIFLANQEENPFGSLIAIYLAIDDERSGVVIKLPGEVTPDPNTGQLTATFDYNPQLPFEDMTLFFRGGGPRSQLATPEVCGHYDTKGTWTPWSAPESGPPAQTSDGFTVGANCAPSPGARPFAPSLEAGTADPIAGAYSPLIIKVGRRDGEQELSRFDFDLPPGLSGKLAGVPYCSEAQIAAAGSRTGKEEQASPSCPAASRLGRVTTAAGVGSEPFQVGGDVYLAGPYKGAPVSTVVITPAVAGPFDLGNVVVRAPVFVDPTTARLAVRSDPIPTILKGFPLKVRRVAIVIDRPGFAINPTSCEAMSVGATIHSSDGAAAVPSNRFQVGGCDALGFKPKLKLFLRGGTKRNANPALTAILTQAPGQANIGKVSVALPHSEFLDQGHIRTICTRVQFAADQCPKGSVYGRAEATSPLLDVKLTGPAYLRSSNNKLPDLVIALRGPSYQPVAIDLVGRIDSVRGGIRNSFELVPDAPVSKFVLKMQGGKKGLLVNSTDICRGKHLAQVKMTAQNGKEHNFRTRLKGQCGKKKRKAAGGHHQRRKR